MVAAAHRGPSRRRVRLADDRQGRRPPRRHAAVQVRRQQDPDDAAERPGRHAPQRVPLRLPGLQHGCAAGDRRRGQLRRLRLRHPDHPPAAPRRAAHRGDPDPDLLRRRDLLRQRHALRARRPQAHARLPAGARRAQRRDRRRRTRLRATSRPRPARTGGSSSGWRRATRPRCSTSGVPSASSAGRCAGRATTSSASTSTAPTGSRTVSTSSSSTTSTEGLPPELAGQFDVILCADVLEHLRQPDELLAGLRGVLGPTGTVLVEHPQLRPLVPAGPRGRRAASTTTSAASSTPATCASSPTARSAGWPPSAGSPCSRREAVGHAVRRRSASRLVPGAGRAARSRVADRLSVSVYPTMFAYQYLYELTPRPS